DGHLRQQHLQVLRRLQADLDGGRATQTDEDLAVVLTAGSARPLADEAFLFELLDDVGGPSLDIGLDVLGIGGARHAGPDRRPLREIVEECLYGEAALLARLADRIDVPPAGDPGGPRRVV